MIERKKIYDMCYDKYVSIFVFHQFKNGNCNDSFIKLRHKAMINYLNL
jgi:hypothetical protein